MEFKGTQGNWEIWVDDFGKNHIWGDGFCLAQVIKKEDAKLISKAPKMLDMLTTIQNALLMEGNPINNALIKEIDEIVNDIE